jgi:hypothetical protein
MVEEKRHGECILVDRGKMYEIEKGERGFHKRMKEVLPGVEMEDTLFMADAIIAEMREKAEAEAEAKEKAAKGSVL